MYVTTARLSFSVCSNDTDLRLVVSLDQDVIYDGYPEAVPVTVFYDFDDSQEQEHLLCFEMRGKRPDHTKVGPAGDILEDRYITIADVAFDDIELGYMFTQVSQYHHNNNDTTGPVTQQFYGIMGCNGRVEMQFTTPMYLWLLQNM